VQDSNDIRTQNTQLLFLPLSFLFPPPPHFVPGWVPFDCWVSPVCWPQVASIAFPSFPLPSSPPRSTSGLFYIPAHLKALKGWLSHLGWSKQLHLNVAKGFLPPLLPPPPFVCSPFRKNTYTPQWWTLLAGAVSGSFRTDQYKTTPSPSLLLSYPNSMRWLDVD